MAGANDEQIDFWNGPAGERWAEAQQQLDALLAPLTERLLDGAASDRDAVLDVGCGCGETSIALARRAMRVTGLDISKPMLEVARRRAGELENLEFVEADASVHHFLSAYDVVFSRFGVMFFADPMAAFGNLHDALMDGGRAHFLCWRGVPENPWIGVPARIVLAANPPPEPPDPRAPGPFAFADADYVKSVLSGAGFHDVTLTPVDEKLRVGRTVEEALSFQATIGPLSRALAELDETRGREVREQVRIALQPFEGENGVEMDAACWLVEARA